MKKYLIILGLIATITSCDDQLDRTPVDQLISETAFETVDDIEAGVVGIYTDYDPQNVLNINDIFTDNAKLGLNSGGQKINVLNQVLNTSANSAGIWLNRYRVANSCNRIIAAAETVTVENDSEQDRLDNLLAQAYGLRALSHFDVLVYYGEDFTSPGALGVPYQDEVQTTGNITRETTQGTVDLILQDLNTANSLLSADFDDNKSVTQDFVSFLKAKVALITEDWSGVINNTDGLINEYPLADQTQYQDMFAADADDTEVIFAYDNVNGFNRSPASEFRFTASTTDNSFIEMSNGLFDALAAANDVRFAVNFDQESDLAAGEIAINKYPAVGGIFVNDFKLMRISEAYLMRAEAFARGNVGTFQDAAEAVQAVKNARSGSAATATPYANLNEAIADIKLERRLELCFEGHRYVDIKRYRNILNEGINRDPRDCGGSTPCSLPVSARRWTFPIPLVETRANVDIQQNPDWNN